MKGFKTKLLVIISSADHFFHCWPQQYCVLKLSGVSCKQVLVLGDYANCPHSATSGLQCNEKLQQKDPMKDLKQEGKSIRKAFLFDPVVKSVLLGSKVVGFKT